MELHLLHYSEGLTVLRENSVNAPYLASSGSLHRLKERQLRTSSWFLGILGSALP